MKKQVILTSIVTGTFALTLLVTPISATSLEEQLAESNARQVEARYQVDMAQNTVDGIVAEVEGVNAEVARTSEAIGLIETEIATIESNVQKKQAELKIAEEKQKEQEGSMNERVRAMYMYGSSSVIEFIFSATDFSDFVTKLDMSRYIITADKDVLNALDETKKVIDEKKKGIEADRIKMVEKRAEQEVVLAQQKEVLAQKDQLLAQNQALLDNYQAIEAAQAADSLNIEAQLVAYYASQQSQASVVQSSEASGDGEGYYQEDTTSSEDDSGYSGGGSTASIEYSGSYVWPCGGPITSPFGWRVHPIWGDSRFHSGVDIGAGTGTPVACAGNGYVISAGWNGGYGNCVIVDIGNGLSAVYAHLSEIYVSAGETVGAGQTVGAVGSTGDSTGPHLHYEIRQNGSPISPYI